MFHMVNEHGNAHRFTESASRRDELLLLGYTEVEAPAEVAETPAEFETPKEEKKPRVTGSKGKKTNAEKKED